MQKTNAELREDVMLEVLRHGHCGTEIKTLRFLDEWIDDIGLMLLLHLTTHDLVYACSRRASPITVVRTGRRSGGISSITEIHHRRASWRGCAESG